MTAAVEATAGGAVRYPAGIRDAAAPAREPGEWAEPDWQRADRLDLGPLPGAVPCARLHARAILREWDLARLADDAEVIVSELVTNAIRASAQPVTLRLRAGQRTLLIDVQDAAAGIPQPAPHAPDAESGHGLEIVAALSERWGYHHPAGGGKVVWAALRISRAR